MDRGSGGGRYVISLRMDGGSGGGTNVIRVSGWTGVVGEGDMLLV